MKKMVKAVCEYCGGTGVYSGMCEPEQHAVVCLGCFGTGCRKIQYVPFKKRKRARNIKFVNMAKNNFLLIVDGVRSSCIESYSSFVRGKVEKDTKKLS